MNKAQEYERFEERGMVEGRRGEEVFFRREGVV
jgi:hypothetical protein